MSLLLTMKEKVKSKDFRDFIRDLEMIDPSLHGRKFTWSVREIVHLCQNWIELFFPPNRRINFLILRC